VRPFDAHPEFRTTDDQTNRWTRRRLGGAA
jgi:hypothetical protein